MASVKKTIKSSKTKQAKRPGTPQAKTAKQSALLKAKRAAAARALASKRVAANKSSRGTKTKTAAVTRRANGPVAAKPVEINLISGEAEASLTFLGATYEAYARPGAPDVVGVMDLGGGSMELVTARQGQITWKVSIPIGSGWLHDRYLAGDPPPQQEIEVAETFLQTYFRGMRIQRRPPVLIVTGGSANSLLHLAHHAFRLEMHHTRLTTHDLLRCQGILSALPAEEIAQRFEQPVERARILLAGACIITAMMVRLRLDEIDVSPHGIREGALLAYARYGEHWLERSEAASTRTGRRRAVMPVQLPPVDVEAGSVVGANEVQPKRNETFEQAGRRMVHERLEKFLEWIDEVLKNEDVEAVHKMRVASRRLRATLDAFESLCEPKAFKRFYRRVKQSADRLGAARDTDVMIEHLRGKLARISSDEQPGMQWLIERLQAFRQEKQDELEQYLRVLEKDDFKQLAEECMTGEKEEATHG